MAVGGRGSPVSGSVFMFVVLVGTGLGTLLVRVRSFIPDRAARRGLFEAIERLGLCYVAAGVRVSEVLLLLLCSS
jgi:hypothetical protein